MGQGTNPQRIGVTGYADQRPIASNASESGKQQNRRVEVLILPTQVRSGAAKNAVATPASATQKPAAQPKLNKDSVKVAGEQTSTPQPAIPQLNK